MSVLLDPRYHWIMNAARRLYGQLDPGEKPVGLSLLSGSTDGEMLSTHVLDGQSDVTRLLVPDPSDAMRHGEEFMTESVINLQEEPVADA